MKNPIIKLLVSQSNEFMRILNLISDHGILIDEILELLILLIECDVVVVDDLLVLTEETGQLLHDCRGILEQLVLHILLRLQVLGHLSLNHIFIEAIWEGYEEGRISHRYVYRNSF